MPLLLAQTAPEGIDPDGYLVSEKFDGVRAWWDGSRLRLRGGGTVDAPDAFVAALPRQPLDGELWLGRGRFDAMSALVRREDARSDPLWGEIRFLVFELPGAAGPFSQRAQRLAALLPAMGSDAPVVAVPQRQVADGAALQAWLRKVVAEGGEGLMLHRADAPYLTGRSDVLLKLKPQEDAEAVVVGYLPGKGRHAGRVGALQVRADDGRVFALGSGLDDALRDNPPAVGSIVTYRHRGLTSRGLPRFATYWRMASPQGSPQ